MAIDVRVVVVPCGVALPLLLYPRGEVTKNVTKSVIK
jgi:hypothetical protein